MMEFAALSINMPRFGSTMGWLLPFGLLLLVIVVVPLRILDHQGLPRYQALRSELKQIRMYNERIHREVSDLQRTVHQLRYEPAAIEKVARDELGMVREGELLFHFSN
jgi:cell division protein FtsB